ncbi:MAG: hypothetical protein ACRDMH_00385 [Solirubrobacterales bacterium]
MSTREERLAEFEAQQAEQEARHEKRMDAVLDGLIRHQLGSLPEAVTSQLVIVADRLLALPGFDQAIQTVHDELIDWTIVVGDSGKLAAALVVGECAYYEFGSDLIVQREHGGALEWARVLSDGTVEQPWHVVAPPKSRATFN